MVLINRWSVDNHRKTVHQLLLLHLPTQMRFLIGGERVTCRGLKLTNSLGKQQLELWTRTWSRCAPWNCGKFVHRSAWCKKPFLIRDGIHYSRKGIYSRKNISCRLTKRKIWTFCVSKLVVWCQKLQKWVAHVRHLACRSWSPGRKVFV